MYVFPNVGRTGLANMLFVWARAEMLARPHTKSMLAPRWTRFSRVGVWLRGERDKRTYLNCFTNDGYVTGYSRAKILATYPRISEAKATEIGGNKDEKQKLLVEVLGCDGYFDTFKNETDYIRSRLLEIVRPRLIAKANEKWPRANPFIAVHVRRGDFAPWDSSRVPTAVCNVQLPIPWFREAINFIRQQAGPLPAVIFTDGVPEEVELLTKMPKVIIADPAPAIVHILAIANATHIVTSASTFSGWGVYLSQATAIWYPGVASCPRPTNSMNLVSDFGIN